jgi:hypothetical protein
MDVAPDGPRMTNSLRSHLPTDRILAYSSPEARNAFIGDLRATQTVSRSLTLARAATMPDRAWLLWASFCNDLLVDPWPSDTRDPIILLQVFARHYRTGAIAPSGGPDKYRTVEDTLRAMGQTLAGMGPSDPRLTPGGKTEFRLGRQLRGYTREDPPPNQVKPVSVAVIAHAANLARSHNTVEAFVMIHMLCIAFFFLCRPDEYTTPTGQNAPFRWTDVTFYVGMRRVLAVNATPDDLDHGTFVTLTFTTQKNVVRGEVIGLGLSGDPFVCPVITTAQRVRHLLIDPDYLATGTGADVGLRRAHTPETRKTRRLAAYNNTVTTTHTVAT